MQQHEQLWNECLTIIRQHVPQQVYDVWFAPLVCERFDPRLREVELRVPSRYVYEYLEEVQAGLLKQVLDTVSRTKVQLNYRIKEPTVPAAIDYAPLPQRTQFTTPNARERLENGLKHYFGDAYQWLPAYDEVAAWLTDNRGRGLLCIGTTGLGKTRICCDILPVILGRKIKTVTARKMNTCIDELLHERCVIIDDLGSEDVETKTFGNSRRPFYELCDAAVRQGTLLVINTHLSPMTLPPGSPYPDSIEHRYGQQVLSRLRAITTLVVFEGKDMWK